MTPEDERSIRNSAMAYLAKAVSNIQDASSLLADITYDIKVPIILGANMGKLEEVIKILKKEQGIKGTKKPKAKPAWKVLIEEACRATDPRLVKSGEAYRKSHEKDFDKTTRRPL